ATAECDNLWAFVLERACVLLNGRGRMSLITPLSLVSTPRFAAALRMLTSITRYATFLSLSGDAHPSVLFAGVKMSFTIFTCAKSDESERHQILYSSKLYRWLSDERENLFSTVQYHIALPASSLGIPFKLGSALAGNI